jgi:hypothetical protein
VVQVVENLPSKSRALSSNPSFKKLGNWVQKRETSKTVLVSIRWVIIEGSQDRWVCMEAFTLCRKG